MVYLIGGVNMRSRLTAVLVLLLVAGHAGAATLLEEGERLMLANQLREATVVLEQALRQDSRNETIYLYLGVLYEQLGETARAVAVMRNGLDVASGGKPMLCFNIANNLFAQGDYVGADDMYGRALSLDSTLGDAYLNRGNTRLRTARYSEAVSDYVLYLRLEPDAPQRPQIEQVIATLGGMMADEERTRQEALARQKALMDEVLNALKNASSDAKNVGAGSENVKVEFESTGIED